MASNSERNLVGQHPGYVGLETPSLARARRDISRRNYPGPETMIFAINFSVRVVHALEVVA